MVEGLDQDFLTNAHKLPTQVGQIQTWSCLKIEVCKCHSQSFGKTCFFWLHVDFQSKISKEQASNNVSFSSCVSRYSSSAPNPPTPQPAINSQSLLHYVAWWCEGPRPDKSTPKTISTRCDKMVFPKKITSQRRASSVTKNVGIIPKKTKAFLPFHQSNELSKNTGYLASWFDRHPFDSYHLG